MDDLPVPRVRAQWKLVKICKQQQVRPSSSFVRPLRRGWFSPRWTFHVHSPTLTSQSSYRSDSLIRKESE